MPGLTASYTGFVNGDTRTSRTTAATLSTAATSSSSVAGGPYDIAVGGAVNSNYDITFVDGALTVNSATLTVTANNKIKNFGQPDPTFTVSYSGFVNGENAGVLTSLPVVTCAGCAGTATVMGYHTLTPSGGSADNYSLVDVAGLFTVDTFNGLPPILSLPSPVIGAISDPAGNAAPSDSVIPYTPGNQGNKPLVYMDSSLDKQLKGSTLIP